MAKNNTYEDPWANYTGNLSENRKKAKTALTDAYHTDLSAYTEGYEKDVAALNEERSLARQQANINHQLAMKYLPTQMKSMGLDGLGVSQSAITDTLANYQNDLTDIDRTYRTSVDELTRGKTEYEAGLRKNLNSDLLSLYTAQEAEDREDALRQEAYTREDEQNLYNEARDLITAGVGTMSRTDVEEYIGKLNLDTTSKDYLTAMANYLYEDDAEDTATYTKNATVSEDVVKVSVGGINQELKLGEQTSIPSRIANDYNNGETFIYDNDIYVKKNGDVYKVLDENGAQTSTSYSRLYDYLTSGKEIKALNPTNNEHLKTAAGAILSGDKEKATNNYILAMLEESAKKLRKYLK